MFFDRLLKLQTLKFRRLVGNNRQDFTLRVDKKPFASLVDLGDQSGLSKKAIKARIIDLSVLNEDNTLMDGLDVGWLFEFL